MTGHWQAASDFLAHALLAGGGVLFVGWAFCRLTAAPARRQFVAAWSMRAAVIAAWLCLLPSWIMIPEWVRDSLPVAVSEPDVPSVSPPEVGQADELAFDLIDPTAVVFDIPAEPTPVPTPAMPQPLTEPAVSRPDLVPWLVRAYAIVASALLGQLVLGHVAIRRLLRSASPAPPLCQDVSDSLCLDSAGSKTPTVLVSDRIDTPFCFGVVRPTVVLPRRLAMEATLGELRWVLAHECDHLRRGDPATAAWAGVARGLFFVWPMLWAVRRDLTLSQEFLADAAAAAAGGQPADYAAFLVDLSDPAEPRRTAGFPSLLAAHAVRAGRSDLFRRVNMVLKSDVSRRVPTGWAAMAACGVLSAAVGFSGLGWAVADDDKPKPEAKKKVLILQSADEVPDAPKPPKPPAPPRPDGERREERRDGERREVPPEVGKIRRQLEDAIKDGRSDEAMKLLNQLERAMMAGRGVVMGGGMGFGGGVAGLPGQAREWRIEVPGGPGNEQFQKATEQAMNALQKQLEKSDDPKAQDEIRRTIERLRANTERMRADAEKARADAEKAVKNFREFQFAPGTGGLYFSGDGQNRTFVRPAAGKLGLAVGRVPEAVYEQIELPKGSGVLVMEVAEKSAAEKAGVKRNDIIVRFAGKDVPTDEKRFVEVVGAVKPGDEVEVVILRKGKKETLTAKLPEPPKPVENRKREGDERRDRDAGSKSSMTMAVTINDDEFEVKATKGDVKYQVSGRIEDGRSVPGKIVVTDDDKKNEYKSVKDVPERHQAVVRQLLGSVSAK